MTKDDIKNAIETAIPPRTEVTNNEFTATAANGTNSNRNFSKSATGNQSVTTWSETATGNSTQQEGVVDFITNTPAQLKLGPTLKDSMTVSSSNNTITLKLNGVTKTLTLSNGTYTPSSLKTELQNKINQAFGTGMGSAIVSLEGNSLVLTSVLPAGEDGKNTNISASTGTSTFLKELNTTYKPAVMTSTNALAAAITIDSSNQTFSFTYVENGTSAEALFGPLNTPGPASKVVNLKTEDTIKIVQGTSDTFTITVNGTPQTVTLDPGDYNRTDFINMLNQKFTDAGVGIKAFPSGDKIGYETIATGTSASFSITYDGGGSSMKAIYGVTEKNIFRCDG